MSRVGKHAIKVPASVNIAYEAGVLSGKSSAGAFSYSVPDCIGVELNDGAILFKPLDDTKRARSLWGTSRSVVSQAVAGLVKPFEMRVNLVGVGYKAAVQGSDLVMQLGYSHDVVYKIPSDVKVVCEKPTTVVVSGIDRQRVGQVIKHLQSFRPPEPYKGKGVIIEGQFVYRKEGKKK